MNAISSPFSIHDFNLLENVSKKAIYQEANETHNVDLVRQLNDLGMKPEIPSFSGPAIISNFMDIATKYDIILSFLKELRQTNRLLAEKEFQLLSTKKWVQKSSLGRIVGSDYLKQKIMEYKLIHIKVPLKVAVVKDTESLNVIGSETTDNLYDFHSEQVKIYAEKIKKVKRKLSRDEIDELIQIIAASNFLDLWPANIVVAEDGIYFIDTEFKSFAGSICWEKMGRFKSLINKEDKAYFRRKVQEKMDEPKAKKENNGYHFLISILEIFNELPEISIEKNKEKIREIKNKISNLEYVGSKEAGAGWFWPNKFSFNLSDIL